MPLTQASLMARFRLARQVRLRLGNDPRFGRLRASVCSRNAASVDPPSTTITSISSSLRQHQIDCFYDEAAAIERRNDNRDEGTIFGPLIRFLVRALISLETGPLIEHES